MVAFLIMDSRRWTIDNKNHGLRSIDHTLFYKCSTLCLLLDQFTRGREFQFHFNLLKASVASHQSLASKVHIAIVFIFKAEVVVQVHAAFDDLAAAIAFYLKDVISFFGFGGCAAKEIFEEAHNNLSCHSEPFDYAQDKLREESCLSD